MVGPIALIALVIFVVRSLRRGDPWPFAVLSGARHTLLGVIMAYGLAGALIAGMGVAQALLHPIADAAIALLPDTQPPASRAGQQVAGLPAAVSPAVTSPPPTPTPRIVVAQAPQPHVVTTPTFLSFEAQQAPLQTPAPTPSPTPPPPTPTATPEPERTGCDPAYPDTRTCIPPGPPWNQGCAITDERRFTVLPPDPQGLDHDKDGIGCEPIA